MEVTVKGETLIMMLDTGAGDSVLCESRVNDRLKNRGMRSVEKLGHVRGGNYVKRVELHGASLGSEALGRITAIMVESPGLEALGLDGILALRSLKHSQVHFDFQSRLLSWRE